MLDSSRSTAMCRVIVALLCALSVHAVSASQQKPVAKLAYCAKFPLIGGEDTQTYTIQCYTDNIPAGTISEVIVSWEAGVTKTTSIIGRNIKVQVTGHPFDVPTGQDQFAFSGYLIQGSNYLPTCITTNQASVAHNQTATSTIVYPAKQTPPKKKGQQGAFKCPSPTHYKPLPTAQPTSSSTSLNITNYTPTKARALGTPTGLRLQVACKAGAAGGSCAMTISVTASFKGLILDDQVAAAEQASFDAQVANGATCSVVSWQDTANILMENPGNGGAQVNIDVCQGPYDTSITQASHRPWDTTSTFRAVRAARYASAIHGCQPGISYSGSLTDTNGVEVPFSGTREWDGPYGMASWGGDPDPRFNFYDPNPACESCFRDGINFGPALKPKGWQTPGLLAGAFQGKVSFGDAAIVFTDYLMNGDGSGVTSPPATIVLFRATVGGSAPEQWLSNLGLCGFHGDLVPPFDNPSDPEAGLVCKGWRDPVADLVNLGLLDDVLRRVNSSAATDRAVYVIGHSRGAALATVFASLLINKQKTGELFPYDGGNQNQIKLYTFGSPKAGDAAFAAYLENHLYERYRIVNRFDAIPLGPVDPLGDYHHIAPVVWFRDIGGSTTSATSGCLLVDQPSVPFVAPAQGHCYISCNQALVCNAGAGVSDRVVRANPVPGDCGTYSSLDNLWGSLKTVITPGAGTLIDHASYMGIDVNNGGCSKDVSMIHSLVQQPGNNACSFIFP